MWRPGTADWAPGNWTEKKKSVRSFGKPDGICLLGAASDVLAYHLLVEFAPDDYCIQIKFNSVVS